MRLILAVIFVFTLFSTADCRRIRTPNVEYIADDGWVIHSIKGEITLTDKVWGGHIRIKHPNVTLDDIVMALNSPDRYKGINQGYLFEKRIFGRLLWVIVRNHEVVTAYFR